MGLESLLKPVKEVDKEILRQYSKITKRWEDKGRSRYSLSNFINVPSLLLTGGLLVGRIIEGYPLLLLAVNQGHLLADDNLTKSYGKDFNATDSERVMDREYILVAYDRFVRLPFFGTGVGYVGCGLYEIISGLVSVDGNSVSNGMQNTLHSLPFIGIASSMYIKDGDPKLLEKEPSEVKAFFKGIYKKAKGLLPSPSPTLQPVQFCSTIDNYVRAQPN